MDESAQKALLPAGLRDVLPPDAAAETETTARLLAAFASRGYEQVDPPLLEFEESLLAGAGAATAEQTFRLMDPVSHRMMGLRTDITVQAARIATTRLRNLPRPLRLCYAGQVLRVKGTQLQPDRQFGQAGIELIGSDSSAADAEIVTVGVAALQELGIEGLSVDVTMPTLVPAVCESHGIDAATSARLRAALDRKDAAAVAALGAPAAEVLGRLLDAAGPADRALGLLAKLDLTGDAASERDRLRDGVARIRSVLPGVALTVDPVEHRGFEYHAGLSFTLFAAGLKGEIGRGGRYVAGADFNGGKSEPATGCTLFVDAILAVCAREALRSRVFLPLGTPESEARRLRADGWVTVMGLEETPQAADAARRLRCSHVLRSGAPVPVE
jgi:ATP phosphoribosyltransferase regulatory subunit